MAVAARLERTTLVARVVVILILGTCLFVGWRELWFLTDDSYITFRHIDQFRRGHGYTWNPPPFLRVEGYSNFLWMILLHGIWVTLGVEPPMSANVVSLLFAYGTVAVAFLSVWRLPWAESQQRWRFWFAAAVVFFGASHRVFLTWSSSGLETSLFTFCVMCWVHGTLEFGRSSGERGLWLMSLAGSLAALTRPDGMLFFLASAGAIGYAAYRNPRARPVAKLALAPLALVPAHLLWRLFYYQSWFPNTFYAKQVRPWPQAGMRYLASFCLEHALWLWPILAVVALAKTYQRRAQAGSPARPLVFKSGMLAGLVLLAHASYFLLIVGGDHFEYRIFSHLILPLGISLVVLLSHCFASPARVTIFFVLVAAFGQVIPWIHYRRSSALTTREATLKMMVPVADAFAGTPLALYAQWFDSLQTWMTVRHVGTRHQEHRVFWRALEESLPSRAEGEKIRWSQRVVIWVRTVGMFGWVYPEVAIIDEHGLTDPVVAHQPVQHGDGIRLMAHERTPPPGYLDCLDVNAYVYAKQLIFVHPPGQLSDARIRECQTRFYPGHE